MKVKDRYGFTGTPEQAIRQLLQPMSDGQMEQLAERVSKLEDLVCRYIGSQIRNVGELNSLAGFEQFGEVQE